MEAPPTSRCPPEAGPFTRPAWALEGRRLGRYRLGPSLGRGGMGEVFRAWDTLLDRQVAIKTLAAPDPAAILRFMKEAQLQARVSHPNVCRIFDVDVSDNVPFIAMQLVPGPSLAQAAPGLSPREAVEILATVAVAMHSAHRVGLIHRDLKPSNILLERSPAGPWVPYVADFGLAKDLAEEGLTLAHGVLGTPSFMAPEQKAGEGELIGPPTDVYALGATLCAVLDLDRRGGGEERTRPGRAPLAEATGSQPSWPGLPRKLRAILVRCLEDRPQDRYATAGALAEDFRRYLDGEPLLAYRPDWFRRARRRVRRHPAWTASLCISLLLGVAFALWSSRLAAASQRRTVLALRFAHDAKELETRMALARLYPPHDLRPLLAGMFEGVTEIQKDIAHLGPEARGPGNLALGRVYLSMRYLEPALASLEAAWDGGYRTPEVAYALCRTHSEFYLRVTEHEQLGDLPPAPGTAARHLQAARDFLAQAAGASWEPQELCCARILTFDHRGAEALAMARALFLKNRWLHEAKVEEARALASLGLERQRAGDARGALDHYRLADAAARAAQAIAPSDVTGWLASADWRFRWLETPGLPPEEALRMWKETEGLLDTALTIRPGNPRAISGKVHVILARARLLKALGRDPRPELARAERFLHAAQHHPFFRWLVPVKEDLIGRTRKELARLS
ncbi:serine/threonine-protein kinase [Mesoterricola silvestris]|uniref:Protein kinase domain-containing protein n=1 Tax=Mesoterricola silvestris TaxID=2927979 RepID=A0AA48GNQ2_9BACT|nr:serine/threonine-protein kinase [Mesoterricola silvestris]BDU71192.1 hypothetical protein METEAL_03660 [Mesoterricola silvestris]